MRIVIDHTFTDPVCDCCIGFLKFKVEGETPKVETAAPVGKSPNPRAKRPRHRLTVVGVVSSSRAISRVPHPSAASSTIRILNSCRCSVVAARSRASSSARSFGFSRTSMASGINSRLNHDAKLDDSANVTQSLEIPGTRFQGLGNRSQRP